MNHSEFFSNKWSFFFSPYNTLWQSCHKDVLTSNRQILNFAKKKIKRSRHEIVISASHFRRLNFFIIHFFSPCLQNTWKEKFSFTELRFFFPHLGHLAVLQILPYLGKNGLKLNLEFKSSGVTSLWILSS